MVVAPEGRGVGEVPDCLTYVGEMPDGLASMDRIRLGNRALVEPSDDLVHAIDKFDPDGVAIVVGSFLNEAPSVAGRRAVNFRRPEWLRYEDKLEVDALWHRAGIAAVPTEVVDIDEAPEASARLDRGLGAVWAVDASQGWHGGAHGLHWVRDQDAAAGTVESLRGTSRRVRVMPFLEGIPCSVHGIVCPDGVVALRPVEMVTLRAESRLVYCGCATFWDPPAHVREEMRLVVRRVGALLRTEAGFAGAFTVDGVVTVDGFRPTELNPRAGAGLVTIGRGLAEDYPLTVLCDLVASGHDLGRSAHEWEAELLDTADRSRSGGTWTFGQDPTNPVNAVRVAFDGVEWIDDPIDGPQAEATVGSGFARCRLDADTWPVGPSVAPAAAAFYKWCDTNTGTKFGPMTPATDVLSA